MSGRATAFWVYLVKLVFLIAFGGSALAESDDADASTEPQPSEATTGTSDKPVTRLGTVTSVSTRTERDIDDVAASVSVISAEELALEQASDLGEALENEPGVALSGGPRANGQSVVVRGVGGTRVLINVDGARQNFDGGHRSRLLIDPDLLKSVEVLRGPASGVYGSGAVGGVVSLTTKDAADLLRPGEVFGARLKLGYEDAADASQKSLSLFGRIGDLDLLANISNRDADDIRQGGGEELPFSALETDSGLYKASWFMGDDHEISLSHKTFARTGISPSNPSSELDGDNPLLDRDTEEAYSSAQYIYAPAQGRIAGAAITVYKNELEVVENRLENPRHDELDFETTGGSAQISFAFAPWQQRLTLGMDLYEDEGSATRDAAPRAQFPDAEQKVRGVFLQNEIQPIDRWRLIPSVRYDKFESSSNTNAAADVEASETSLGLGTLFDITDWLTLHANYGEAFRAPNLVENYAAGTHFLGNEFRPNANLRPENAANLDLGFRLNFENVFLDNDELRFKATHFKNDVEDFIETVVRVESAGPFPPPAQCPVLNPQPGCISIGPGLFVFVGGFTTSENLPEAELKGYETQAAYQTLSWLFELSYDQVRGQNKETGDPLLNIPADTLRAHLSYRQGNHHVGVRVAKVSDQDRIPPADDRVSGFFTPTDGYTTTDLYYQWAIKSGVLSGLTFIAGIDNVSDRNYRRHLSLFDEPGRSGRASLSYQFGL